MNLIEKINGFKNFDLYSVLVLSAIFFLLIELFPAIGFIRVVLGIPFMMFFPGYVIVSVLWPEKADGFSRAERLGLSIGLSIVLVSLVGVVLSYTSIGILLHTVLISLWLFITGIGALAIIRRNRVEDPFVFEIKIEENRRLKDIVQGNPLFVVLCVGIIATAAILGYVVFTPESPEEFTALYALGPEGNIENYPKVLNESENATLTIGIYNHELTEVEYTIVATMNENASPIYVADWNQTFELTNTTSYARNVTLMNDQTWEEMFNLSIAEEGRYNIIWFLLIDGKRTDYKVQLWVDVT